MSNRLAELEQEITGRRRKKNGRKRVAAPAPPHAPGFQPASAPRRPGQSLSAVLGRQARRARAFSGPVDYAVPAPIDVMRQPTRNTCWATAFTMLHGWKKLQSMPIDTALADIGQRWVDLFKGDKGLSASDKVDFVAAAGLVAEPPMNFTVEGWERLLRSYGPLWVTTDERPGQTGGIHARILTAIRGDGTPSGTKLHLINPSGGREQDETVAQFIPKFEAEVAETGRTRIQVLHWPPNARAPGQSLSLRRSRPAARAFSAPSAGALETVAEARARLKGAGVPDAEMEAFLREIGAKSMALGAPAGATAIRFPAARMLARWQTELISAALMPTPIGTLVPAIRALSRATGTTVGVGPSVTGGMVAGFTAGAGVLFAPDGRIGLYGSAGGVLGAIVSIGASMQVTVVKGGPDVFGGEGWTAGVTVDTGVGPSIGAHALFNRTGFIGVTGEIGVSAGLSPFEAFASYQWTGTTLSLAPEAYSLVEAFADIPLDPGAGGQSILVDACEKGDIILSTTNAPESRLIRFGMGSEISHAGLYLGGGEMAEAVASGVRIARVEAAQMDNHTTVMVAFRYPGLTPAQQDRIAGFARGQVGRRYDYVGIVRQAPFQLAQHWCRALEGSAAERCRRWTGKVFLGTSGNDTFFCSELVVAAYQAAGVPLTAEMPSWTSPEDLRELHLSRRLGYVGHLKT